MADEEAQQSTTFHVGDDHVDAWGNHVEEDGETSDGNVNYHRWKAPDLVAEVERRNAERDEEDKITFDGKPKKSEVADALVEDDKAQAEAED